MGSTNLVKYQHEGDLRVQRTIKAIRDAFYSLSQEKSITDISITELTERACISRKTFYLHYETIDDLFEEILYLEVSELMPTAIAQCYNKKGKFILNKLFPAITATLVDFFDRNEALFPNVPRQWLMEHVEPILIESTIKNDPMNLYEKLGSHYRYFLAFYIAGILASFAEWVSDESRPSTEEFTKILEAELKGGITGIGKLELTQKIPFASKKR